MEIEENKTEGTGHMKPKMTFEQFRKNWFTVILPTKPIYLRKGQSLMNYLEEMWKEEYQRISSVHYYDKSDIDCFYNDSLIPNTLNHLEKVWPK